MVVVFPAERALDLALVGKIALLGRPLLGGILLFGLLESYSLLARFDLLLKRLTVFAIGKKCQRSRDHHRCDREVAIHLGVDGNDRCAA